MDNIENLMVTLSEECSEVIKEVNKTLRFGPGVPCFATPNSETNAYRIVKEALHIQAMIEMLQEEGTLPRLDGQTKNNIKEDKKRRVRKWQEHSREIGLLK